MLQQRRCSIFRRFRGTIAAPHSVHAPINATLLKKSCLANRCPSASSPMVVADFVIAATDGLHHPHIAGLDTFAGGGFHSASWHHDVELEGKQIGVIGTGSTASEIASALADKVARFDLFQRTAQWIMPIESTTYTEQQKQAFRDDFSNLQAVRDRANAEFEVFSNAVIDAESQVMHEVGQACLANLEGNSKGPVLRETLRPDYRADCKRLVFSSDFYDAIQ